MVRALVSASSLTGNSFYVNIDAEPEDPVMSWDINPVTSGFEQRLVSWRGNGTAEANQFVPQVFQLTAGTHQLIIRGREPNTFLQWLSILRLSARYHAAVAASVAGSLPLDRGGGLLWGRVDDTEPTRPLHPADWLLISNLLEEEVDALLAAVKVRQPDIGCLTFLKSTQQEMRMLAAGGRCRHPA